MSSSVELTKPTLSCNSLDVLPKTILWHLTLAQTRPTCADHISGSAAALWKLQAKPDEEYNQLAPPPPPTFPLAANHHSYNRRFCFAWLVRFPAVAEELATYCIRALYQVVPEKRTSIRGLVGSDRAYDVSAVSGAGAAIPILGDNRSAKVCFFKTLSERLADGLASVEGWS